MVLSFLFLSFIVFVNYLAGPWIPTEKALMIAFLLFLAHSIYDGISSSKHKRVSDLCLKNFEKTINDRTIEPKAKNDQLTSVLSRLKNERDKKWENATTIVQERLTVIQSQLTQYEVKMLEINALRWQNVVNTYLSVLNPNQAKSGEIANWIRGIDQTIASGKDIIKNALKLLHSGERESLVTKMDDAIGKCHAFRDALIAHEATLAIQGTGTLKDALSPLVLPNSLRIEDTTLNENAFTEFSESLKALEFQYEKLHAEDQTADLIRPMIAEAERLRR